MDVEACVSALDSLDQTLGFVTNKVNSLSEEAAALDAAALQPLKFSGLQSVEAARVTLQTFFSVMLDLNVYKRDLEIKCIESDEAILGLNQRIRALQTRVEELMLLQGVPRGEPEQNRV